MNSTTIYLCSSSLIVPSRVPTCVQRVCQQKKLQCLESVCVCVWQCSQKLSGENFSATNSNIFSNNQMHSYRISDAMKSRICAQIDTRKKKEQDEPALIISSLSARSWLHPHRFFGKSLMQSETTPNVCGGRFTLLLWMQPANSGHTASQSALQHDDS